LGRLSWALEVIAHVNKSKKNLSFVITQN